MRQSATTAQLWCMCAENINKIPIPADMVSRLAIVASVRLRRDPSGPALQSFSCVARAPSSTELQLLRESSPAIFVDTTNSKSLGYYYLDPSY